MSLLHVELDCYQGPLDLLLVLVRRREVDVLEIALARVAQAYVEALGRVQDVDLDAAGDFLVLLSSLMEIKSQFLIPTSSEEPSEASGETPVRSELVRQLLEYKRFKEAGALLWERAKIQQQRLARVVGESAALPVPIEQPIRELELWDLVSAFSRLMNENIVPVAENIELDPTPISVYMDRLEESVLQAGGLSFRALLGTTNTRSQLVGKFLALLELIKSRKVWIELGDGPDEIQVLPPRPQQAEAPVADVPAAGSIPLADPSAPPAALVHTDERCPWPESAQEDATPGGFVEAPQDRPWSDDVPPDVAVSDESGVALPSAWDDFESVLEMDEPPAETDSQARMARLDEIWPPADPPPEP